MTMENESEPLSPLRRAVRFLVEKQNADPVLLNQKILNDPVIYALVTILGRVLEQEGLNERQ